MASFNSVILLGNLTRDPELRYTPQGVPVASFAVAVNRRTKEDGADCVAFVDIEAWGRLAEVSATHLKRGRQVLISGELRQDRWVDEASKKNRSKLFVVAGELEFLGGKGTEGKTPIPEEAAQAE
jgi:single-strand DNA-binding protein